MAGDWGGKSWGEKCLLPACLDEHQFRGTMCLIRASFKCHIVKLGNRLLEKVVQKRLFMMCLFFFPTSLNRGLERAQCPL